MGSQPAQGQPVAWIGSGPGMVFPDSLQGSLGRKIFKQDEDRTAHARRAVHPGRTMYQYPLPLLQTLDHPASFISQPGMTCALAGAKRPYQIEETAAASGWILDEATLAQVEQIMKDTGAG